MKKDYKRIYIIIGTVLGVALLVGTSYALLNVTTRGEKTNIINAGKLSVEITDEANEIYQINPLPLTDEGALRTTPYTFKVTNTGTMKANYDLTLDLLELTFAKKNIKYYLTKVVNGEDTVIKSITLLSEGSTTNKGGKELYTLDSGTIDIGESYTYKLYMWVDYNTTADEAENHTCKAKVRVDSQSITTNNNSGSGGTNPISSVKLRRPTTEEIEDFDYNKCVAEGDYSQPKYNRINYNETLGAISANIDAPSLAGVKAGTYVYFFQNLDFAGITLLTNQWYYMDDDAFIEYNGSCPFVRTDFRSKGIASESYYEAIVASFSN